MDPSLICSLHGVGGAWSTCLDSLGNNLVIGAPVFKDPTNITSNEKFVVTNNKDCILKAVDRNGKSFISLCIHEENTDINY